MADFDTVIVGGGFAGVCMLHRVRGLGLTARVYEAGTERIEPTVAAEDAGVAHVNEVADGTLYPTCNSWYLGSNIPGKPRVFMPYLGFPVYVQKCEEVAAKGYDGFALTPR